MYLGVSKMNHYTNNNTVRNVSSWSQKYSAPYAKRGNWRKVYGFGKYSVPYSVYEAHFMSKYTAYFKFFTVEGSLSEFILYTAELQWLAFSSVYQNVPSAADLVQCLV